MRIIVAGKRAVTRAEFAELALGLDFELFAGVPGESAEERAARLDAAEHVLQELRAEAPLLAAYAARLLRGVGLPRSVSAVRAA